MRNLIIIFFLTLIAGVSLSQKITNSPFSAHGLGEVGGLDHPVFVGFGNATITLNDSAVVNYYNPATYSTLREHIPLFSLGISSKTSVYSENGYHARNTVSAIQHFTLAFPIAKYFGLAFGLKPYSARGYEFSVRLKEGNDSLKYVYLGNGSINEAFVGFSAKTKKYKGASLALGGNLGYIFGALEKTRKSGLIVGSSSTLSGGVSTNRIRTKAIRYTLGMIYEQSITQNHQFAVAFTLEPSQKFSASFEDYLYYSPNIDNPNVYDTLIENSTKGYVTNIPTMKYGLRYDWKFKGRKNHRNPLNSILSLHLNYAEADWSRFENSNEANHNLTSSSKISFGIEYQPEIAYLRKRTMLKFYHRLRYRAGLFNVSTPYMINGNQVINFGTTFGIGIPIATQNSLSNINIGFSMGAKGTSNPNELREKYYGISLGVSIAPGADKWFIKRKLD